MLSIALVLGLGTLSSNAQTGKAEQTTTTTTVKTTEEFKDIKVEELPEAVRTSVAKSYPGSVINSAAANDTKTEFKLNVTASGQTGVIYTDPTGTLIKKK